MSILNDPNVWLNIYQRSKRLDPRNHQFRLFPTSSRMDSEGGIIYTHRRELIFKQDNKTMVIVTAMKILNRCTIIESYLPKYFRVELKFSGLRVWEDDIHNLTLVSSENLNLRWNEDRILEILSRALLTV